MSMKKDRSNREKRRRRRLKNQFFAYLALIVIIALILAAGSLGVKAVIRYVNNYTDHLARWFSLSFSKKKKRRESKKKENEGTVLFSCRFDFL